eukprot:1655811-Amphidinium_carterae.1
MSGARWEQLNQAFNQFLCTRTEETGAQDQIEVLQPLTAVQDIISVVQFATDARVTLACAPLAEALRFKLVRTSCSSTWPHGAHNMIPASEDFQQSLVELVTQEMKHGATFFRPPLQFALQLIQQARETHPSLVPLLIFMSDGENKDFCLCKGTERSEMATVDTPLHHCTGRRSW